MILISNQMVYSWNWGIISLTFCPNPNNWTKRAWNYSLISLVTIWLHIRTSSFVVRKIYSLFIAIILLNSCCTVFWVSSFYLSVNIVVLYQFTVTCIERRLKIAITSMFSRLRWRSRARNKGMDLWKEMSSKCSFTGICGIVLPLNPSATTVYARSAFYPNLRFTLSLQSAFYPWSAVCSP